MSAHKLPAILLMLTLGITFISCEKKCENATCTEDQNLSLLLVDDSNNNLVEAGLIEQDKINLIALTKDTIQGIMNRNEGTIIIQTYRDLGHYTLTVGGTANVDLQIFQNYINTDYECCPGYWRIDSVYARGAKLAESPDGLSYYLKVD